MIERKPPVRAIAGDFRPDIIRQAELKQLSLLQASEYLATNATRRLAFRLQARIAQGASVEEGALLFDQELGMARGREGKQERRIG